MFGWTIDVPRAGVSRDALLRPPERDEWLRCIRAPQQRGLAAIDERVWVVTHRPDDQSPPGEFVNPVGKGVANTNLLDGYATLTDYGPLMPNAYFARFGFEVWGERKRPEALLADTRWMRPYRVGWVLLTDAALPPPAGLELVLTTTAGWRLYRNEQAAPAAYFEDPATPGAIEHESLSPTRLRTRICSWPANRAGPLRLVVSQLALPGWRATIDGRSVPILASDGLLLSVEVPRESPESNVITVDWSYWPPGLSAGIALSLLTLVVFAADWVLTALRQRLPARPAG
jgi:hypothetical protein